MNKSARAGNLDRASFLFDNTRKVPQSDKYNSSRLREMLHFITAFIAQGQMGAWSLGTR